RRRELFDGGRTPQRPRGGRPDLTPGVSRDAPARRGLADPPRPRALRHPDRLPAPRPALTDTSIAVAPLAHVGNTSILRSMFNDSNWTDSHPEGPMTSVHPRPVPPC